MLKKDEFLKYIDAINKVNDRIDAASKFSHELGLFLSEEYGWVLDHYTSMLEHLMGDERDAWISWWLWDCSISGDRNVVLEDGEEINLDDPSDLYDFIVKEYSK